MYDLESLSGGREKTSNTFGVREDEKVEMDTCFLSGFFKCLKNKELIYDLEHENEIVMIIFLESLYVSTIFLNDFEWKGGKGYRKIRSQEK